MKPLPTLTLLGLLVVLPTPSQAVVTMDWAYVGDIGNAADPLTGYGSVGYGYYISKHEVTNAQYAEFLNAVDAVGTNPNGIYNTNMTSNASGGITFDSGAASGGKYAVKSGYENMPVVYVSHLNAQRFANWIHNGQGSGSTETGAYTVGDTATHIATSNVWIPTEDEWYKAAYYDPSVSGPADDYWLYPTRSDSAPSAGAPSGALNRANYGEANPTAGSPSGTNYLSDVGAYSNASSYYGTFDQAGNVWEWNDAIIGSDRGLRGGSWDGGPAAYLTSSYQNSITPILDNPNIGFRLASSTPEPSRAMLLLAGLCATLMRRRRWAAAAS